MDIEKFMGKSYPNQNKQKIHRRKVERYLMDGIEEIREAAGELTHGALKLYLYLCENVDGYEFWLSPTDFMNAYKCSKSTYDRAKAELIRKGYMKQEGRVCHFYCNKRDCDYDINGLKKKLNLVSNKLREYEPEFIDNLMKEFAEKKVKEMEDVEKSKIIKQTIDKIETELNRFYSEKDVFDI